MPIKEAYNPDTENELYQVERRQVKGRLQDYIQATQAVLFNSPFYSHFGEEPLEEEAIGLVSTSLEQTRKMTQHIFLSQSYDYVVSSHSDVAWKAYLKSISSVFDLEPEKFYNKFDLPVLVEPRIPWVRQAEFFSRILVAPHLFEEESKGVDLLGKRMGIAAPNFGSFETPAKPYLAWMRIQDYSKNEGKTTIQQMRGNNPKEGRWATLLENISFLFYYSPLVKRGYNVDIDVLGSFFNEKEVPTIGFVRGPEIRTVPTEFSPRAVISCGVE